MDTKALARKHIRRWNPVGRMTAPKLRSFKRLMHNKEYTIVELSKMLDVDASILSRYRSGELEGKRLK